MPSMLEIIMVILATLLSFSYFCYKLYKKQNPELPDVIRIFFAIIGVMAGLSVIYDGLGIAIVLNSPIIVSPFHTIIGGIAIIWAAIESIKRVFVPVEEQEKPSDSLSVKASPIDSKSADSKGKINSITVGIAIMICLIFGSAGLYLSRVPPKPPGLYLVSEKNVGEYLSRTDIKYIPLQEGDEKEPDVIYSIEEAIGFQLVKSETSKTTKKYPRGTRLTTKIVGIN